MHAFHEQEYKKIYEVAKFVKPAAGFLTDLGTRISLPMD
jgi:hypothetical protein